MTIYEKAKSLVTACEAAEHYGLTVNRYGMRFVLSMAITTPA